MISSKALIFLIGFVFLKAYCLPKGFLLPEANNGQIWALLVAGSSGWGNYRHQADISHAYHILVNHGVQPGHIITMMYDDIANNQANIFPGKVFNRPYGNDVYSGVKIDYKGEDVTVSNFLAVLQGNVSATKGGNGRVIQSTSKDNIFIYFSDHGSTGFVCFPNYLDDNGALTVGQLKDAIFSMHSQQKYQQLVFYMEACESGSMFDGIDYASKNVYALTAANPYESSFAIFCPPFQQGSNQNVTNTWDELGACLGDEFSVRWMEISSRKNLNTLTLKREFERVKNLTLMSHVSQWGDLPMSSESVALFQGSITKEEIEESDFETPQADIGQKWDSRDVELLTLKNRLSIEKDPIKKSIINQQFQEAIDKRAYFDNFIKNLVFKFNFESNVLRSILFDHPKSITKYECHTNVVKAFGRLCFNYSQNPYVLKYGYVLANLCEYGLDESQIMDGMKQECAIHKIKKII